MPKSWFIASNSPTSTWGAYADNATRYAGPVAYGIGISTEARIESTIRDAGTASNLSVNIQSPNGITGTSTVTLRKNLADTALTVSITSGSTGLFEDTSNTVTYAAGDEMDWEVTVPSVAGTVYLPATWISCVYKAYSNTVTLVGAYQGSSVAPTSATTYYQVLNGFGNYATANTEAMCKWRARAAFTSSDLRVYVITNGRTGNSVIRTRLNGSNGGQSVTFGTGVTGALEDTTGSDTIAVGDDFNFLVDLPGTSGTWQTGCIHCSMISTGPYFPLIVGATGGRSISTSTTNYIHVAGFLTSGATEGDFAGIPRFNVTVSNFGVMIGTNGITATTTFTVRDGGADTGMTVSVGSSATGLFEDATNTAVITSATDRICYKVVTGGSGSNISPRWIGVLGRETTPKSFATIF